MTDIDQQIRATIAQFTDTLAGLVKQAAIRSVTQAFGGSGPAVAAVVAKKFGRPAAKAPVAKVAPVVKVTAVPAAKPAKKAKKSQVRRGEKQIAAAKAMVLDYVGKNPGKRSEELRAGLKMDRKTLADSLVRLKAEKKIKSKGQKRATTYSV